MGCSQDRLDRQYSDSLNRAQSHPTVHAIGALLTNNQRTVVNAHSLSDDPYSRRSQHF